MADNFETFRNHFLSIYQSAVTEVARRIDQRASLSGGGAAQTSPPASSVLPAQAAAIARREDAINHGAAPLGGAAPTVVGDAQYCAELALQYLKASLGGDAAAQARIEGEFKDGTCDPEWVTVFKEYLQFFGPNGTPKQITSYIPAATVGTENHRDQGQRARGAGRRLGHRRAARGADPAADRGRQSRRRGASRRHLLFGHAGGMRCELRRGRRQGAARRQTGTSRLYDVRQSRHVLRRRRLLRSDPDPEPGALDATGQFLLPAQRRRKMAIAGDGHRPARLRPVQCR